VRKAAILYGLFVGLVFAPFFLLGEVFVPGDFLSFIYPWKPYSEGFPHNIELFDVTVFFYPQDVFLNQSLKAGILPLWNPHIFNGHPSVGSGQSGFFYPPRLLVHTFLSTAVAKTLLQLTHLFGMGMAMFWFFRVKGFGLSASLLGGLVWMGNANVASWMEFEHVPIAGMYLALLLVAFEKAVNGNSRWWLALAPLGALCLHSGHLQISLYMGGIFLGYVMVRLISLRSWDPCLRFLGVGLLTIGLSAPTVVPFFELLSSSQRVSLNPQDNAATLGSLILSLFNPDIWGNPTTGFLLNRCKTNLVYPEFACFAGIVPLVMAVTARGKEARVLQVVAIASLILASSLLPFTLPFMEGFIPGRILLVLVFCLAYLATIGAEQVQTSVVNQIWCRRLGGVVGVFWLAVLGCVLYFLQRPETLLEWWHSNPQQVKLPPTGVSDADFLQAFWANYSWNPQLLVTLIGPALLFFRPTKVQALIGVTLIELILFSSSFNTSVPRDSLFPSTPEIQAMQDTDRRVVSINSANYNTLTPYGLSLVNGYESLVDRRYGMAVSQTEPGQPLPMRSLSFHRLDLPMVDALSVEYALLPPFMETTAAGWEMVLEAEGGKVYRNLEARPRWYLLGKVAPLHNLTQLQSFDPSMEAFVSDAPPASLQPSPGSVELVRETPNTLELIVETETTQLLVVTDAYNPGWKCWVNGQKVNIFPTNMASRGVYLNAGVHRVEFRFLPDSLFWGIRAVILCLLITLGLFLFSFRKSA
jgi:membrane protein YfhO